MTTTYLSVWLPRLPTDRLKRSNRPYAAPKEEVGLATLTKIKGAQRLVSVDAAAARHAVKPSMTLADARAIHPSLVVADADPQGEAATLDALAAWCGRFTPLVALDGPDGLVLDISGVGHLFGGQEGLLAALESDLQHHGFTVRLAVAATPEAAWAFAHFSTLRIAPLPADDKALQKQAGALPIAALRLDPEIVQALAQAGLRRIGDLLWRPRAPLTARFGYRLFERLDALMGQLKHPISPRFDPPAFVVEQLFASPLVQREAIEDTLLVLANHLCALLERQHKGARSLVATLFRVDGVVKRIAIGTSRPLHHPEAMVRLFRERIDAVGEEGLDTGYGFDLIRLAAGETEALPVIQTALVAADTPPHDEALADLVDRLGARLGLLQVTRLQAEATHIPELAAITVPAARSRPARPKTKADQEPLIRPIRLFDRPEPIEAVAVVPDGPPRSFRWRRNSHEVTAIEGPERIAPEWWKGDGRAVPRDYFRAEDRHGRRFWLFREGSFAQDSKARDAERSEAEPDFFAPKQPAAHPRWYIHGLFC